MKNLTKLIKSILLIFIFTGKIYSFGSTRAKIALRSLDYLHVGDTLYLYEYDPLENPYIISVNEKFKKISIKTFKISADDSSALDINNEVILPAQVYINKGNFFVNLYYWTSGKMETFDPILEGPSQVIYFDDQGRHQDEIKIFVGTMGRDKIILSYAEIKGKIFGCYRYLGRKIGSKIFELKILNNKNLEFKLIEKNEKERSRLYGIISDGEIRGKLKFQKEEILLDVRALKDPHVVQGYYTRLPDDTAEGHMCLSMNDDGTYLIYFEEIGYRSVQFLSSGYLNDIDQILWKDDAGLLLANDRI